MKTSKKQIMLLKTLQREAGMSDADWREFLSAYGVSSCTQLEQEQVDDVLTKLESMGAAYRKPKKLAVNRSPQEKKQRLLTLTSTLLSELNKPLAYANGIARNIWRVENVQWLTNKQLYFLNNELIEQRRRELAARGQQCKN